MRPRSLSFLFLLTLATAPLSAPASAEEAPRIDALRAAKIATDYLRTLGHGAPHIVSLTLDKSAIVRGQSAWVARWSRPIKIEGDKELGLRVNLDGSTARLVEGPLKARNARNRVGGL